MAENPPFQSHSGFALYLPNVKPEAEKAGKREYHDVGTAMVTVEGNFACTVDTIGKYQLLPVEEVKKNYWWTLPIMGIYGVNADGRLRTVHWKHWGTLLGSKLNGYVFLMFPESAGMEEGIQGPTPKSKMDLWKALHEAEDVPLAIRMSEEQGVLRIEEFYRVQLMEDLEKYKLERSAHDPASPEFEADQEVLSKAAMDKKYSPYMFTVPVMNQDNSESWAAALAEEQPPDYICLDATDLILRSQEMMSRESGVQKRLVEHEQQDGQQEDEQQQKTSGLRFSEADVEQLNRSADELHQKYDKFDERGKEILKHLAKGATDLAAVLDLKGSNGLGQADALDKKLMSLKARALDAQD
eukprot:gene27501-4812_t